MFLLRLSSFKSSTSFISSVQSLSRVRLFDHGLQHARPPCPSPTPGAYSNPCPLSQWCHPTVSSSVIPFSLLQSFPASGSFQMSQFLTSGGQSIGVSALASVLPMNIQDWFSLGWTGWISLLSKRFSRVFSSTTIRKHQFFDPQPSLWSISTVEINVPQFWRIQSPSSSHWQILCMVRIHCLIHRHHLFAIASQGRRNKGVPWGCLS